MILDWKLTTERRKIGESLHSWKSNNMLQTVIYESMKKPQTKADEARFMTAVM